MDDGINTWNTEVRCRVYCVDKERFRWIGFAHLGGEWVEVADVTGVHEELAQEIVEEVVYRRIKGGDEYMHLPYSDNLFTPAEELPDREKEFIEQRDEQPPEDSCEVFKAVWRLETPDSGSSVAEIADFLDWAEGEVEDELHRLKEEAEVWKNGEWGWRTV